MYEQRIEIPNILRWYLRQWKQLLVGVIAITIVSTIGFYVYAQNAYTEEMGKRLTKEQFEETMEEYDCQVAQAVLTIDELLKAKNQRLQDIDEEYENPINMSEDILLEKEELIQRIYWLDQLRQMYFIDFSDEQARYYNLLCGNDYPPLAKPTVTGRMIFQGAALGILAMLALVYLEYVLGGYLHSPKEMKVNFKAPVCVLKGTEKDFEQSLRFHMEIAEMPECEAPALISFIDKKASQAESVAQSVNKVLGGEVFDGATIDTVAQKYMHEHQNVYALVYVNHSKVTKVKKLQELCENVGAEIKGIIVITE